jgi:ABC-type lipoprotein release transport system permease subunit
LRKTDVRRVISWQSAVVVGAALAVGVPLGLLAGRAVWRAMAEANRTVPVVDVPALPLVVVALGLLGVALAGAVVPGRRAAGIRPADALRSE